MENPKARKLHVYLEHTIILKDSALSSGKFSIQRSTFKKYEEPNRHHNCQATLHNRKQTKVAICRQLEPKNKTQIWSTTVIAFTNSSTIKQISR